MPQRILAVVVVGLCALSGCGSSDSDEVVVYAALDQQFSEPILRAFTQQTGIRVRAVYDTEAQKTVGLTNRIRSEANRPRCDVFWNNEILNTLRLKREGLLQPCSPSRAAQFPAQHRDPEGYWYGFAARARVIIVNTDLVAPSEMPRSIRDFADPKWKGRAGIARPLAGTTASHVAALFAHLGEDEAAKLLASFKANDVQILPGNKGCAERVAAGDLAFALTDTDDALIERELGRPVAIAFPDAGPDEVGTLLLPNTLALIKDCPHPEAGARLIDFLLSPEIEDRLAEGPSGQLPLHPQARAQSRAGDLSNVRRMPVDFAKAAEAFDAAAAYVEQYFLK